MSERDELAAVLEGDGSRPLLAGGVTARGMLNEATSPMAVARGVSIVAIETTLYIASHRLPDLPNGGSIRIGAIDAAETTAADPTYIAHDRVPQDDGLMHAIKLGAGVVL